MTRAQWHKMRQIFEAALAKALTERTAYLTEACGEDTELRKAVEEILIAHDQAGSFIEHAPIAATLLETEPDGPKLVGQRLGSYRVLRELGRGGMGTVYLAARADGEYSQQVAIKLMRPGLNQKEVERFRQERQILADLDHPNIARLIDAGTTPDGVPYVVMELVAGQSLRQMLMECGQLSLGRAVEITRQVSAGLGAAHQRGIVHRDIKPENIVVATQGEALKVKVLDFGIAKLLTSQEAGAQTSTGGIVGTAAYMSPEQAAGAVQHLDARSDIYSLGMVIYEMLTERVAFTGESCLSILRQQQQDPPPPPSRLRPDLKLPPGVERVVLRALEKDPNKRQQTVGELAGDLESAYLSADPALNTTARHEPPGSVTRHRRAAGIFMLVLLLLGLSVALERFVAKKSKLVGTASLTSGTGNDAGPRTKNSLTPTSPTQPLQYRVKLIRRGTAAEGIADDHTVRAGDRVWFEFRLSRPGALYLFFQSLDGLLWLDARASGQAGVSPPGEWLRVPENTAMEMNESGGTQQYIVVYVPAGEEWSLGRVIPLEALKVKNEMDIPYVLVRHQAAGKLRAYLAQKAAGLIPAGATADALNLALPPSVDGTGRIMYYTILLNQLPGKAAR
jgi:serine/threonine protein kinase